MKKGIIVAFFVCLGSLTVSAQSLYFDVGIGFGKGWTFVGNNDMADVYSSPYIDEIALDVSLKVGAGPFGSLPLYVVGEVAGVGHRFFDNQNYMQFNSYLIGPGIIFYPIPLLQFGLSFGYSYVDNDTDVPDVLFPRSKNGFAGNVSAAIDLGAGNSGILLGMKYFYGSNVLKGSGVSQSTSMLGIFVKYAIRQKPASYF